jgi:flagellar biosynthetic protein FliQ
MTEATVIDIARQVVWVIVKTSAPMLIVSLVIGLIISIFQTITSIQEQTLTFVPKFLAIMLVLILCGGWMMGSITELFVHLLQNIPEYIKYR